MSEPDVADLLTVAQAIEMIDAAAVSPRAVDVPLGEADGFVLAEDVRADRDYPPFDKSLMDGYAVRAADVKSAPAELRVIGEIPAGAQAARGLAPGEAIAIMTGAPLPNGADAVVPVEDTQRTGDIVRITRAAVAGRFISTRGADLKSGAVAVEAGSLIGPAQLAAAASVGAARIRVFAKPRVAVLSTGDEIVPFGQKPSGSRIRNSNSIMLVSLLRRMGCEVIDLGIVRDDPTLVRLALTDGLLQHDALFVTGGMSMGAHDHVPRTLREIGVDLKITKLRIKPGKPFVFGIHEGKRHVFGLPGNPVSAFVCTVRLASRLIVRLRGARIEECWIDATLATSLVPNGPREFYHPVTIKHATASPLAWKGSADVFTLAKANGLLIRRENEPALEAGTPVRVLEI